MTSVDRRASFRRAVAAFFSDDLMVLLALLLIPATLFPILFTFSPFTQTILAAVNYFVIAMFAAEYACKLAAAERKREFVLDPWHLLDLLIIVLALLDFVPIIPGGGRAAPLLRLVRLTRVFAVAGRAAHRATPQAAADRAAPAGSRLKVRVLGPDLSVATFSRDELARVAQDHSPAWIDLQEVSAFDLDLIASAFRVPAFEIQNKVLKDTFPQVDYYEQVVSTLIRNSRLLRSGEGIRDLSISRDNVLILCAGKRIVTLSAVAHDLFDRISRGALEPGQDGLAARVFFSILQLKNRDCEEILDAIEQRTIFLEEQTVGSLKKSFLEETFFLKREITNVHNGLRHFNQALDDLRRHKTALAALGEEYPILFKKLADEAATLQEISDNTLERLVALIELYINTVSLDMNRVMRLLAIITCLGLIPSIIGGLLGMNLIGNPWHASIYEICLLLGLVLLVAFYVFWKKGWFR